MEANVRWIWQVSTVSLRKALRWIKYRTVPRHKYHMVNTGLKPGYYDQDRRMLHACFALLLDYVKEYGGVEVIEPHIKQMKEHPEIWGVKVGDLDSSISTQEEILKLYEYWVFIRHGDLAMEEEFLEKAYGKNSTKSNPFRQEYRELEEKIYKDEQEMLHRLINIRQNLWV